MAKSRAPRGVFGERVTPRTPDRSSFTPPVFGAQWERKNTRAGSWQGFDNPPPDDTPTVVSDPTVNVAPVIGATPDVTPAVWSSGASDTQRWEMAASSAGPWSTVSDMPAIDSVYTDQTFGKVLRWYEAQGGVTAESAATAPAVFSSLKLWYDPSRLAGSDGAQVGTVTDYASGYNATRTPSAAVVLKTNILGGKSILRYDGTGDFLVASGAFDLFRNIGSCTIVSLLAYFDATTQMSAFTASNGVSPSQARAYLIANATSNAGKFGAGGRRLDGVGAAQFHGGTLLAGEWNVHSATLDYANSNLQVYDGTTKVVDEAAFLTDGNTSDTASLNMRLGSLLGAVYFKGDQADTLVFVPALTESELFAVVDYLGDKYSSNFS